MKKMESKKKPREKALKELAPAPSSPDLDRGKIAELYLYPHLKAANLILKAFSNTNTAIDPAALQDSGPTEGDLLAPLLEQMQAVTQDGNMKGLEAMLVAQAHSLDALFFRLAKSGMCQTERPNLLALLGLSIRAQGACRATIETLSAVKNPPSLSFVRQANIAGIQQVNNGQAVPGTSPAREITNSPNELMEVVPDETKQLDAGAPATDATDDPWMEAVDVVDRSEVPRGEEPDITERVQGRAAGEPAPARPGVPRVPRRVAAVSRPGDAVTTRGHASSRRVRHGS